MFLNNNKKFATYIQISSVKWLIVINLIQNKRFYLYNICMCAVYIYYAYIYINTHMHVYIFQKNRLFYMKYIYLIY